MPWSGQERDSKGSSWFPEERTKSLLVCCLMKCGPVMGTHRVIFGTIRCMCPPYSSYGRNISVWETAGNPRTCEHGRSRERKRGRRSKRTGISRLEWISRQGCQLFCIFHSGSRSDTAGVTPRKGGKVPGGTPKICHMASNNTRMLCISASLHCDQDLTERTATS